MNTLFALFLWFGAPILIGRLLMRSTWRDLAIAYTVWVSVLSVFGLLCGRTWGESIGWPMIFAMFFSILVIPTLLVAIRLSRLVRRVAAGAHQQ